MTRDELATVGYINDCFQAVLARLDQPGAGAASPAGGPPQLLSIEQVAQECGVHRATVQRWIKQGKPGRHGDTVKLRAYYFSSAEPRIPWPALAAFGQGLDFDLTTLDRGAPNMRLAG
ncbi:helix-turn-helix domain-containing protein [Hymenobacter defluvii]|uniref:Helix-turn-helix domain-containing protein n=1 Tax=Hymenobacter defluvii TaxID=2054411 RepID=A0ABS3TDR9_9BACT|nr:helix-turn-helix domain-containing protein [Hymenobacter defluvii]MBO3270779.1 helix-turn-helix domain-containing protein [Hymenobacter defluvii]